MGDSRRGFLTKCLGGLAIPLGLGASAVAVDAAATEKKALPFSPSPDTEKSFGKGTSRLTVETDFTPPGTSVLHQDDGQVSLVDELLVYRPLRSQPWVGAQFLIPHDRQAFAQSVCVCSPKGFLPELRYEENRNCDAFPALFDAQGRRFPLQLMACQRDRRLQVDRIFMGGLLPVKFTRSLEELKIAFMRCKKCGFYHRCLTHEAGEPMGFTRNWVLHEKVDTSTDVCPRCRHRERERIEYKDVLNIEKLYMTPTSSHLVFSEPDPHWKPSRAAHAAPPWPLGPGDLDVSNRPQWLGMEVGKRPVAQVEPKPSPFAEAFSVSFASLLSSL